MKKPDEIFKKSTYLHVISLSVLLLIISNAKLSCYILLIVVWFLSSIHWKWDWFRRNYFKLWPWLASQVRQVEG